jgi:hypothetical protein
LEFELFDIRTTLSPEFQSPASEISFNADRTTSGKTKSFDRKAPRSCADVRAPMIALEIPGASLTQLKAISRGAAPKPSAAVLTAVTICLERASK